MKGSLEAAAGDPVSQRDIARHFGVSHVTVSLALRNSTRVSKTLADKIRNHAEEVGYRRDPVLFALASYRQRKSCTAVRGAIAWINAWHQPEMVQSFPEIERFRSGASEAALEHGFRLDEFRLGSELAPARLHQVLQTRNIRGLVLPPHPPGIKWQGIPWQDYAIVTFGRIGGGPRGHQAVPSAVENMALSLRTMCSRGYRRIGCLTGSTLLRHAGYCMEESLPAVRRSFGNELPFLDLAAVPEKQAASKVRGWIREHDLEAVLADDAAVARWIAKAGFSVPGDIALATLAREGEAGMDLASGEIGRTAIQMLDVLMREKAAGFPPRFRQVAVEGTWVDGASLPRLAEFQPA